MGNSNSSNRVRVTVIMGDVKYIKTTCCCTTICWTIKDKARTHCCCKGRHPVMMAFVDINGRKTEGRKVTICSKNNKAQNKTCTISNLGKNVVQGFGTIQYLEIWRKSKITSDRVFINHLEIEILETRKKLIFPIHRWIPHGKKLCIRPNDAFLPQDEMFVEQRKEELEAKQELYKLVVKAPGLPPQCEEMPEDESFSTDYQWNFTSRAVTLTIESNLAQFTTFAPVSFKGLKDLYHFKDFPLPKSARENWFLEDEYFGEQRVSGCNPIQITLCTSIPERFAVNDEMVKHFIEDKTLQSAMDEKRLFILDYSILANLDTSGPEWQVPAPFALLYRNAQNQLMPIAIQLQQRPSQENPVFLPSDPHYTWLLAKMWVNLADSTIHQAKAHLGCTHLIAETICVTTHRELSPSHPIFRLLAPHFLFLIAINNLALSSLVAPGGLIDQTMAMGRNGTFDTVRRTKVHWRFDVHGNPKTDAENRGVGKDVLPHYPYRDDAISLYEVIHEYVTDVVHGFYTEEARLREDHEIQAWYRMLSLPASQKGAGLQGIPGDGETATIDDIIAVLATTIFISCVQHAAVNFNQYDQYGFPAVYPAHIHGKPPTSKKALAQEDVMAVLPDTGKTNQIMVVTKLLSERGTKALGDFEVQYAFDPITQKAADKFRSRLESLREDFALRNIDRNYPYKILDPGQIPNAISI